MDKLNEKDREYLKIKGYNVEVFDVNNVLFIVFRGFRLPDKYTPVEVDLLVQQPAGYPDSAMDMFWTYPEVKLKEGNKLPAATEDRALIFEEKTWQRWSRHHNGWRSSIDCLETFMNVVYKGLAN